MKIKRSMIAVLCLVICIAANSSCNQENMSRVTLYFGDNLLASSFEKQNALDKLFNIIFPSAYAGGKWGDWTATYDSIQLTISGSNIDTITASIPPGVTRYTIEVPMGSNRQFYLFAYQGSTKKWGGHVIADTKDSEVDIPLNVFPIVTGVNATGGFSTSLTWNRVAGAGGYYIYRSTNPVGPFTRIDTFIGTTYEEFYESPADGTYYYYVNVYYAQGEGEPSDIKTVVIAGP